jgi:UDP-N-acetyl-D-glucosamine dehydrogenase
VETLGKVAIVGQGYVGLPLAALVVKSGYSVVGIDNDILKINLLKSGKSYIEDVGDAEVGEMVLKGRYEPSDDYGLISGAKYVIFCLPTPVDGENQPDLSILLDAVKKAFRYISMGSVVISESTSFPGTLRNLIAPEFAAWGENSVYLGVAPERVDPANASFTHSEIPRLVSGLNEEAIELVKEFYESLGMKVVTTSSPEVAEAAKLLENTFRQVNIALVNEFTKACAAIGIDVREIIEAAATKPYGFMKFSPGPGVGGHCIPVDPHYLTWISKQHGFEPSLVELANKINHEMPLYVISRFEQLFSDGIKGKQILIAGIAYKAGVSDLRESPALEIISQLKNLGAKVSWYDPLVSEYKGEKSSSLNDVYEGVIVTLPKLKLPIKDWVSRRVKIFDCTGFYRDSHWLYQL